MTTPDPIVQAVAEAMCPTHREDVPIPLPDHHDPRLRYAACFDCARKAEVAVAAARPLIEAEASAERDELAGRLSALLCDLTNGRMSKTGYDVRTMVQEVEAAFAAAFQSEREADQ